MEKEIKTKVANGVKKVAVISSMIIETILFLLFLSPVDNNNNKLDNLEKKVYASRTKKILLFELLGFMLLVILNYSYWSCVLMISIFITAILVLAGYLQNRMEKN